MRKGMKKCAVLLLSAAMVFETVPMTVKAEEESVIAVESTRLAEREAAKEQKKNEKTVTDEALAVAVIEEAISVTETDSNVEVPDIVMGGIVTGTIGPNRGISFSYNSTTKSLTISGSETNFRGGYIEGSNSYEPVSAFDDIATDIETIVVQNCTLSGNAYYMFANQKNLKSVTFSNVNTSNVIDMAGMFYGCESLESLDLGAFNTANVRFMEEMFDGCSALKSLNVSSFNTANVTNMAYMFAHCSALQNLIVANFNTANVDDMFMMFYDCSGLTNLNLSNFRTSNVDWFAYMFADCTSLQNLDISNFNTSNGVHFDSMFRDCTSLKKLDLRNFNTANAKYLYGMFDGCTALESVNVSSFNTKLVEDMGYMFHECEKLTSIDVRNFNTANVIDMTGMFDYCIALKAIDLSSFNTAKVTDMSSMFYKCESLERLDLSNFDLSSLDDSYGVLYNCDNLNIIYTPKTIASGKSISLPGSFNVENGGTISEITKDYCNKVLMKSVPTAARAITLSVPKAVNKITINNSMQITVSVGTEALPVANNRDFKWTVSNPNVLSVSDKGVVTGVGMGTATITCTNKFYPGETASYQFAIEMPFTDIKATDWQYPYVLYAYQNSLMNGKGEGKFDMNGNITRGEFVVVLHSNASKPAVAYEAYFTDVPEGKWFTNAVIWAKNNGVTAGNPNGTFGVNDKLTREQLVVMLYGYAKNSGVASGTVTGNLSSYADTAKVSTWATEAFTWAVQNGIITGKNRDNKNYLDPQSSTSRGECATMMMRYVELAK